MSPSFDNSKKKLPPSGGGGGDSGKDMIVVPEAWTEPRCHVCISKHRRSIDKMVALGTSFSEISRVFGGEIDRRSIANHAKKHLGYEDSAVRQIIEREALEAQENAELGIQGATMRRVYLNTALQKAFEQLVMGEATIEVRDAVAIAEKLEKMDSHSSGAQLDEIKMQFNAFLQAIREVAAQRGDPTLGSDILIRARQILGVQPEHAIESKESTS